MPRPVPIPGTLPLGNTVHRPGHWLLLPRTDRVAFFQQLGERRARAYRDCVLQLFRQVGECHIGVNCLNVS